MKGGNYAALEAVRQIRRAAIETPLPITMLLTPDEEVGSPSARDIIEAEAARNKYVLVPEPALAKRRLASLAGARLCETPELKSLKILKLSCRLFWPKQSLRVA